MSILLKAYKENQLKEKTKRERIASQLGVSERKVRNWFYSRRAKDLRMNRPTSSYTHRLPSPTVQMRPSVTEYVKNHTLSDCTDVNLIANSYDGVDDGELAYTINNNLELREHFNGKQPPLLSGTGYDVISNIGSGCYGRVILAQHIITKDMVVVKIPLQVDKDPYYLDSMLKEFVNQEKAYYALRRQACTAPQPLGFIRMKSANAPQGFIYLSVSEYIPVLPNAHCTLTVLQACREHGEGRSLINREEWVVLIQDLIDATNTLLNNDISHNDIKEDNIMIQYRSDGRPKLVLIDYGLTTKQITSNYHPMFELPSDCSIYDSHNAPELFFESSPLPTSDLYSVAKLVEFIGHYLQLGAVKKMASEYCLVSPRLRKGHHDFCQDVTAAFNGWVPKCNLPQIGHLVSPSPLYY